MDVCMYCNVMYMHVCMNVCMHTYMRVFMYVCVYLCSTGKTVRHCNLHPVSDVSPRAGGWKAGVLMRSRANATGLGSGACTKQQRE